MAISPLLERAADLVHDSLLTDAKAAAAINNWSDLEIDQLLTFWSRQQMSPAIETFRVISHAKASKTSDTPEFAVVLNLCRLEFSTATPNLQQNEIIEVLGATAAGLLRAKQSTRGGAICLAGFPAMLELVCGSNPSNDDASFAKSIVSSIVSGARRRAQLDPIIVLAPIRPAILNWFGETHRHNTMLKNMQQRILDLQTRAEPIFHSMNFGDAIELDGV